MSFDFQVPGLERDLASQNNHSSANETKLIEASRRFPPLEIGIYRHDTGDRPR
jgi:hypothetical protein